MPLTVNRTFGSVYLEHFTNVVTIEIPQPKCIYYLYLITQENLPLNTDITSKVPLSHGNYRTINQHVFVVMFIGCNIRKFHTYITLATFTRHFVHRNTFHPYLSNRTCDCASSPRVPSFLQTHTLSVGKIIYLFFQCISSSIRVHTYHVIRHWLKERYKTQRNMLRRQINTLTVLCKQHI